MTGFALALVLVAAVLHATWNYCAKRAGGRLPFVWLVGAVICTLYVPVLVRFLNEANGRRRIWAAVATAAGVIALALG